MGKQSSERAWASRARKKGALSPEERERLARYDRERGHPGRPRRAQAAPAPAGAPPTPEPPPAAPAAAQETPAAAAGAGGPPIDLDGSTAPPAASAADTLGAEDAAIRAAAERAELCRSGAAHIVGLLRACEPVIRAAEVPLPPLPELALVVVGKAWEVTLDKWMPDDVADPKDYAELVACASSGYQLSLAWWAGRRLRDRGPDVVLPGTPAAVAAPSPSPPAAAPPRSSAPSSPPPPPNPSAAAPPEPATTLTNFWGGSFVATEGPRA